MPVRRSRSPEVARRLFDRVEPVHAVTYFAPEARAAFDALGYRGFWMGYFAARSAPLGVVPTEVVTAAFYNFAHQRVAKALPSAWAIAPPAAALTARLGSAVRALRRAGVTDEAAGVAGGLAARAALRTEVDGRVLFGANRALHCPEEPLPRLWHAVTMLREHRGDGHVAVLLAEGVSGRDSNVLHSAAGRVPAAMIKRSRDYDDDQWQNHVAALAERGLLTSDGAITEEGQRLKEHIEHTTDARAVTALDPLDDDDLRQLFHAMTPLTRLVIAAGDIPEATPMGLNRDGLHDDAVPS